MAVSLVHELRNKKCPICKKEFNDLGNHIKSRHGISEFNSIVLKAKENGLPDKKIGEIFGITFKQLEKIITDTYGINISNLKKPKKIKYWSPKNFKEEQTTVWSFPQRGSWATHDGRYRGNWSPYIPRNVILKYSKPGDTVLDYFVGGGTTAIEAKLLGRKCIAKDINHAAVNLTKENLQFTPPRKLIDGFEIFEPQVYVGDACDLSEIDDETIDLICAHPPYAGIISYSSKVKGDLSQLNIDDFLKEMGKVACESFRVLKPGGKCAILIGDSRKNKRVIPIGFKTIEVFLEKGFKLKELVIKRQHKCKTTGFWYDRSIKFNFLLLAHEYLPIFEKPSISQKRAPINYEEKQKIETIGYDLSISELKKIEQLNLETTTVWIFPKDNINNEIRRNLLNRYGKKNSTFIKISLGNNKNSPQIHFSNAHQIIYAEAWKFGNTNYQMYFNLINEIVEKVNSNIKKGDIFIIDTQDYRTTSSLIPSPLVILNLMDKYKNLKIKEIVVVTSDNHNFKNNNSKNLESAHRYLLIYQFEPN